MKDRNTSIAHMIHQALRIGLNSLAPQADLRYWVVPHALGLRPGLDPDGLNRILDDIEVLDRLAKLNAH